MPGNRLVGDWIANRYEIYDIHLGAMGIVYVVYDHQGAAGQRVLAIKTLRHEFLTDPRQVNRFVAECATWIKLERHPHIVRAYSVQVLEDRPYVLMELVTGGSLRRWIGTPHLTLPRALRFGIQCCLGMEHAVQRGLICHRDIKPENLMISDGGTLKITDFGVAKVRDEAVSDFRFGAIPLADLDDSTPRHRSDGAGQIEQVANLASLGDYPDTIDMPSTSFPLPGTRVSESSNGDTVDYNPTLTYSVESGPSSQHLTQSGAMIGTLPYMAPEQFHDARTSNIQSDIYALGIVLFEMLTGTPPFQGPSLARFQRQHARDKPPSVVPFIPNRYARVAKPIERILSRCLEKDRTKRFASLAELRLALARCLWRAAREQVTLPTESELEAWELTSKGVSLGTLGRYDEERDCYEEAIRIKPNYVPAWFNQSAVSGMTGHPDEAIDYADVALQLNPSSVPALINKGLALNVMKHPDHAIACFDRAVHLQPRSPEAWYGRGVILISLENYAGAKAALGQALRLRPEFPEAIQADAAARSHTHLRSVGWVRRTEEAGT